eukprot:CAMPEP_0178424050 /NCGR_PEP_ID=MMETSP0689_2-20121128/28009_1 /TAXON_ID=160604 /ORGANISM="Amphidinium massartii, Strain CS-259" /LENGTH=278 /DNA_ID=CAMNT_0020045673 /DNA_START=67 /DNA_END=900 /DNA_ORIENTATION=+
MLKRLQSQLEEVCDGLEGDQKAKDIFVFIVDRANTGCKESGEDGKKTASKLRTRLSSKAMPFVPTTGANSQVFQVATDTDKASAAPLPEDGACDTEPVTKEQDSFCDWLTDDGSGDEGGLEDRITTTRSGVETMPVKHTFIHFNDEVEHAPSAGALKRSASAPSLLLRSHFTAVSADLCDDESVQGADGPGASNAKAVKSQTKTSPPQTSYDKVMAHARRECTPCAFYAYKEDGCRWGDSCLFCHLCPKGEIKARRRMRYVSRRTLRGKGKQIPTAAH